MAKFGHSRRARAPALSHASSPLDTVQSPLRVPMSTMSTTTSSSSISTAGHAMSTCIGFSSCSHCFYYNYSSQSFRSGPSPAPSSSRAPSQTGTKNLRTINACSRG
ncbi:hypothetical protein VTK26DRAFT_7457 [Humicola hyalothermophila]